MDFLQGDYKIIKDYCNDLFSDDYYEFEFPYVSENENFKEINRFLWESKHECTRYKNRYEGNYIIGLTEWNNKESNKYFDAFMYFLKDSLRYSRSCVFFIEERINESLIEAIEKHFDVTVKEFSLSIKEDNISRKIGFCIETDKEKDNVRIKI